MTTKQERVSDSTIKSILKKSDCAIGLSAECLSSTAIRSLFEELQRLRAVLPKVREALEFYQNKDGKNYQFIFDDETGSRGQVYEKYKEHSIGDMGVKATEALALLDFLEVKK